MNILLYELGNNKISGFLHIIIIQHCLAHERRRDQIYLAVVNMQFLREIEYWIQYCNNNNNDDNEISNLGIYFAL